MGFGVSALVCVCLGALGAVVVETCTDSRIILQVFMARLGRASALVAMPVSPSHIILIVSIVHRFYVVSLSVDLCVCDVVR